MPLTLTPDQERKLKAKAARAHKSMDAVLDDLLSDNTEILNGATYPIFSPHDNPGAAHIMQEALADNLLQAAKPAPDAESLALIAMLRQWREEDAAMSEEELEESEKDWQELKANFNENRRRNGEEPLFP